MRFSKEEFDEGRVLGVRRKRGRQSYPFHGHDFCELDIILEGTADTVLNGEPHKVQPGEVYLLTPDDFHEYANGEGLVIYHVSFAQSATSLSALLGLVDGKNRIFRPCESEFDRLIRLVALLEELCGDSQVSNEALSRLLECILLMLKGSGETGGGLPQPDRNMQKATVYIHAHFKENPALSDVAERLHINERYFCKKFREYTGLTYKEYLRGVKLRYAKRMILASPKPIIEIATESGYGNQSHFNREFKQFFGITPLEMRHKAP